MENSEVKRSWKKTIITLVVVVVIFTGGGIYSKSIGYDAGVIGCMVGSVIGCFLVVSILCPKDKTPIK